MFFLGGGMVVVHVLYLKGGSIYVYYFRNYYDNLLR